MNRLQGKLAVITAAGSGMGRAAALLFAREGAQVCVVDYDGAAAEEVAAEIRAGDRIAHAIRTDLLNDDDTRRAIARSAELMGGIDVLWNHAGEPGPGGIENLDMAAYQRALDLNLRSAVVGSSEVVAHMRRRGGGALLFTASISGLVGSQFAPIYSLAKFGVVGLAKSLALALAADRIRVNVICPGLVRTPMLAGFMSRSGDAELARQNETKFVATIPLQRVAEPEEIAQAALWLASDDASYVTGVALPVDGGFTSR